MANPRLALTRAHAQELVAAWERAGHVQALAAAALGLPRKTYADHLAAARALLGDTRPLVAPAAVPAGLRSGKTTVQYDAKGNVVAEWRRLHPEAETLQAVADTLCTSVDRKARPLPKPARKAEQDGAGRCLEVPLFDQHFGKYCWSAETGQDFDSATAEALVIGAVSRAAEAAGAFERAVLLIGGDYFHADSRHNTTERGGHVLDVDTRQYKVWEAATRALYCAVEVLGAKAASVHVVVIPGNHDWESSFHLQRLLAAYYRDEPRVTVLTSPRSRQYMLFGSVLIGWAHGRLIPMADLPLLMAQEVPEWWASAKERVWHLGHIHKSKTLKSKDGDTFAGVKVEHLESLCATDAWHHEQGYVGSPRRLECFVWHKQRGLVARHYVTAEDAAP